ncbi:MAG: lysylphosphatidylglycerol synthase domain-containing protein [Acidimicrobiales bacterium]
MSEPAITDEPESAKATSRGRPGATVRRVRRVRRALADKEPDEADARIRRPADLLAAFVAIGTIGLIFLAAHSLPGLFSGITNHTYRAVRHLPRLFVFACAVVAALSTVALLVAMGFSLARRRRGDGVNALVAGGLAALIGIGLIADWHTFPGGVAFAMLHRTDGSTFVRDATIIALITGSDTARYHRWGRYCTVIVSALVVTGLALDEVTVFGVIVAAMGGFTVGLVTRWALRTTVRRPSIDSLVRGLRRAGIDVRQLERLDPDSRELSGSLTDSRPIVLKAAGREVHGAGILHRLWSAFRLRGAATGPQPISFRAALQTEALASLMASNTGVIAPRVLLLAHFEPDTLVLARERLDSPSLDSGASSEQVEELFRSLRKLHEIGVAHRDLRPENLVFETGDDNSEGRVGFRSLESAVVGAGELVRRLDLAQLLTAVGSVLGASRAVAAMRGGYHPVDEQAVAATLQPVALSGWGWSEMRGARSCLTEVRRELIGENPTSFPEAKLQRFRWRTVAVVGALVFAAFLIVGQLSKVNLVGALQRADWAWFAIAVIGSALTYVGSSLNLVAFVPQRVSITKGALVEVSGAFFGLVTPPTVGHLAINGRYLHKQGVDMATTASAVALSQLVNVITTVTLLVVMTLLTGTGVGSLKIVPGPRLLAVLAGLIALGGLLITIVPWTKELFWHRVWPRIRGTWPQLLDVLSQPLRLLEGVGGNLLLTGSYVLALVAALHAVGAHPPIIATAAVFMAGNTVGAAAPTPGGLGAVEAVLVAGLTAVGISARDAVTGVLLFRVATFWLPILPGWIIFLLLQRKNVL